jgi:hypothetical protein
MEYAGIAALVARTGLALRGGFHPGPEDAVPTLSGGHAAETVLLIGMVGGGAWPAFRASPEFAAAAPNPLDAWSRRVGTELALELGGTALFPFEGPPYWPFQRWAMRAEAVSPSPLGILIHPEFGLWHGYRAALLLPLRIALPARDPRPSPCLTCAEKPCLSACPVTAFTPAGYDVGACAAFLSGAGGSICLQRGCRARDACPVGSAYRYPDEQIGFHMEAFHRSRRAAR